MTDATSSMTPVDAAWLSSSSFRILAMQLGFAVLEIGCVRLTNTANIMMKNLADLALGVLSFSIFGYALFKGSGNMVFGTNCFFLYNAPNLVDYIFNFSFAATASTIDSGAVAGRMSFYAYLLLTTWTTGFIYPIAARSIWNEKGLFASINVHDFAGAACVHLLGACSGCVAALMLGQRRIINHILLEKPGTMFVPCKNEVAQITGTILLAIAWLSFNCGSVGLISQENNVALVGQVAANTLIGGSAAMIGGIAYSIYYFGAVRVEYATNTILGGLVAITANCDVINPRTAFIIGLLSIGPLFIGVKCLTVFNIDDPLYALPVHGCCAMWGMIATGLFSTKNGLFYSGSFELIGVQCLACLGIMIWSSTNTWIFLKIIEKLLPNGIRVPSHAEDVGLDFTEHHTRASEVARVKLMTSIETYLDTLMIGYYTYEHQREEHQIDKLSPRMSLNQNLVESHTAKSQAVETQSNLEQIPSDDQLDSSSTISKNTENVENVENDQTIDSNDTADFSMPRKDVNNPIRNLLIAAEIDVKSFYQNWLKFKDLYSNHSQVKRMEHAVAVASMTQFIAAEIKAQSASQRSQKIMSINKKTKAKLRLNAMANIVAPHEV